MVPNNEPINSGGRLVVDLIQFQTKRARCRLVALSGQFTRPRVCLLSGVKRVSASTTHQTKFANSRPRFVYLGRLARYGAFWAHFARRPFSVPYGRYLYVSLKSDREMSVFGRDGPRHRTVRGNYLARVLDFGPCVPDLTENFPPTAYALLGILWVTSQRYKVNPNSVACRCFQLKLPGLTLSTKPLVSSSVRARAAVSFDERRRSASARADMAIVPLFLPL